jgi:hypothetical protein
MRSFDRALFNCSPTGQAVHLLQGLRANDRREVLRLLDAGWRGESLVLGPETLLGVTVSNLWKVSRDDLGEVFSQKAQHSLATFFVIDAVELEADLSVASLAPGKEDAWWANLIQAAFKLRTLQDRFEHALDSDATAMFVNFYNRNRREIRDLPEALRLFAALWPDQVLKLVLLMHIAGDNPDEKLISAGTLETAFALLHRLGVAQLQFAEALPPANQPTWELEIEKMVAKIKIHGPQRKRDLFRRFNGQNYSKLEPVLVRCLEKNLLRAEGELLQLAN